MIEFRTLGALDLRRRDGPVLDSLLAQPKRIALLAFLCLGSPRGFHRRDTLLGLFWPESDQLHARASLRRALHVLRISLGEDAILSRGDEEIGVNTNVIWCDAVAFEEQLAAGNTLDALALYIADLLPGFFVDEASAFERWLSTERNRLRSLAARAARIVAEKRDADGDLGDATEWARRATELSSNDERVARWSMELLARAGNRASALQLYHDFAARLQSELEAEPSAETRALADQLRASPAGPTTQNRQSRVRDVSSVASISANLPQVDDPKSEGRDATSGVPRNDERLSKRRSMQRTAAVGVVALGLAAPLLLLRTDTPRSSFAAERKKLTFTGMTTQGILSPDGQFLAYVIQERDSNRLVVQDMTGGPADTLVVFPREPVDQTIEWSPNGARILMKRQGKILLIHRHGRFQEIVPGFRVGDKGRWYPDGRVTLYNFDARRLVLVNTATGDSSPIRIPPVRHATWDGAWSHDGREFAVITELSDSSRWSIRGITLDGRIEPLVEDSVPLAAPRWADGGVLYYLREDAIWRLNVSPRTGRAASSPERVESGIDVIPGNTGLALFSVSRDGHKLVYAKGERYSNIYRVEPGDSNSPPRMDRLTSGVSFKWSPVLSPDGKWIAFGAETNDGSEIFRMPNAGGLPTQVTYGALVSPGSEIAWSPDGAQIAFQTSRAHKPQIWVADVSSGEMRGFQNTTPSEAYLTWAPGLRIAYAVPRSYIHLLDPKNGRDELLSVDTTDAFFHFPRYSPNGNEIAMVRYDPRNQNRIAIVRVADGATKELRVGLVFPRAWSVDGRSFFAQTPFVPKVLRIDATGRKPPEAVFTAPVREMECTLDTSRPRLSFICMMFDFNADIWMIKNFDSGSN